LGNRWKGGCLAPAYIDPASASIPADARQRYHVRWLFNRSLFQSLSPYLLHSRYIRTCFCFLPLTHPAPMHTCTTPTSVAARTCGHACAQIRTLVWPTSVTLAIGSSLKLLRMRTHCEYLVVVVVAVVVVVG
jgi:hypothetical protein